MDYKNGVIYKICCKDENIKDVYVGSSCSHTSRKSSHKSNCNNKNSREYNYPVYRYIRDNGGWENWQFVLLEAYPCENKNQLVIRERYWFELLGARLNNNYPQRSYTEYYEGNKEEILEKAKENYEKNKEEFSEKNKEYYEENKEEIKERRKKHYEENKEEILEKEKERYKVNKEKISEKGKETVECPCGSVVRKDYLQKHKKTQKHQKNLQKLSESKTK
jgi:hypothetical protein